MERLIKRLASQQWTERKERGEEKELTEGRKGIGKTMEESRRGHSTPQQSRVSGLWQL